MPPLLNASNQVADTRLTSREFAPIMGNTPVNSDPYGFLPWLRRIRLEKQLILEWNNSLGRLQVWFWPVVNGQRVPPSELNALRLTHNFRGPCCLCASQTLDPNCVTEAAIFLITTGRLAGEYAAACARSRCKYWIFIERVFPRMGLPIRACTERVPGSSIPAAIEYRANDASSSQGSSPSSPSSNTNNTPPRNSSNRMRAIPQRPAKCTRTGVNTDENSDPFNSIPNVNPVPAVLSTFNSLMQLDSIHGGGLSEDQFHQLFVKCRRCRMVATRTGMRGHVCRNPVIDLTGDSN